jgi:hypothetical protein
MSTVTLNGPVVARGVHNVVLRDAVFHSPVSRDASAVSYHHITVGIREGEYTSWVGSWDQSVQSIEAGEPRSVLNDGRAGMRLKAGQAIVVMVETVGSPATLSGSRLNFTLALVGGRDGPAKPLVAAGALLADSNSRTALATIERQINDGGLSEWEEAVQLVDPVTQGTAGTFQGRLQRDSSTQISVQRWSGDWIEVGGEFLAIGTSGAVLTTSDGLLSSAGAITSTAPSSSTLYYVYVGAVDGEAQLRLSATAPTRVGGIYYLGAASNEARWRFVGWAYLNASTQFTDSETAREVVNYHNRVRVRLLNCPAYNNGNAQTSYTQASTTYAKVNGGTNSDVSFIANGEDAIPLEVTMRAVLNVVGGIHGPAIGIDGVTDVETSGNCLQAGSERIHTTVPRVYAPTSAGRHVASLLGRQSSGTATIYADIARNGASADPKQTFISGWAMA